MRALIVESGSGCESIEPMQTSSLNETFVDSWHDCNTVHEMVVLSRALRVDGKL